MPTEQSLGGGRVAFTPHGTERSLSAYVRWFFLHPCVSGQCDKPRTDAKQAESSHHSWGALSSGNPLLSLQSISKSVFLSRRGGEKDSSALNLEKEIWEIGKQSGLAIWHTWQKGKSTNTQRVLSFQTHWYANDFHSFVYSFTFCPL